MDGVGWDKEKLWDGRLVESERRKVGDWCREVGLAYLMVRTNRGVVSGHVSADDERGLSEEEFCHWRVCVRRVHVTGRYVRRVKHEGLSCESGDVKRR